MIRYYIFVYVLSLIVVVLGFIFEWTYKIEKFDKVLDSVITFSSIILGFLGALLGILITIKDSNIMKKIYKENHKKTIKFYFSEAIIFGFLVVIVSTILHLFVGSDKNYVQCVFFFWIFLTSQFFFSSYRVISTLMHIMFKSDMDDSISLDDNESFEIKEERKFRLAKDSSKKTKNSGQKFQK